MANESTNRYHISYIALVADRAHCKVSVQEQRSTLTLAMFERAAIPVMTVLAVGTERKLGRSSTRTFLKEPFDLIHPLKPVRSERWFYI